MNEELVNKKIENLKEEMLSKQMEDFSSMLDNYKTNLETLESNIDTYLNEKKTIVLFDGKEVVLNITSEELSRLSKEELYSLILQTNNRLMECKQYLEDCLGRISKIKISYIYIYIN